MIFLPEQVWFLGQGRYMFFLQHEGKHASITVDTENHSCPQVVRYINKEDREAEIYLLEGTPTAIEIYAQDFRVNWDFKGGPVSVSANLPDEETNV